MGIALANCKKEVFDQAPLLAVWEHFGLLGYS